MTRRNVYVIIKDSEVNCYSNLTKAINHTPQLTYSPIYRALKSANATEKAGYRVIKTTLQ